jgi:hypothetical protein
MMNRKLIYSAIFYLSLTSCASQITTANSLITTVYVAKQSEVMESLKKVVGSMENYYLIPKNKNEIIVQYDPSNPVMGSASVLISFVLASGLKSDGESVTGIELVYTDVTPLLSQDTTFSGADLIDRLKSPLDDYLHFKRIQKYQIQRF